jgi:Ca2+-binding RTX toxin-like protein
MVTIISTIPTEGNDVLIGVDANDYINALGGDDKVYGGLGNDTLLGGNGNDMLYGESGNDILEDWSGNNIYDGGLGDDILRSDYAEGLNTYIFGIGAGKDTIYTNYYGNNYDNTIESNKDKIKLGAGITINNLILTQNNTHLTLSIAGNSSDSLTINGQFYATEYNATLYYAKLFSVDYIQFFDGSLYTINNNLTLKKIPEGAVDSHINFQGTNYNDIIAGDDHNENISSSSGNDSVYGGAGDDQIHGGSGDDILSGNSGDDTLNGDTGFDELYGGTGADTYDFTMGIQNSEIIIDQGDSFNVTIDTVKLYGIESNYIIGRQNTDLKIISKYDSNDRVTIKDFFVDTKNNQIEQFIFTGTSTVNGVVKNYQYMVDAYHTQLPAEIIKGTVNNDVLAGNDGNDIIDGLSGDDMIYAGNGHDEIYGGVGNDILSGNAGYDYIEGGRGNDELYGGNGGDTYVFNIGDGQDAIINIDSDAINTDIDTLKFTAGVAANQLWFARNNNNLDVSIIGSSDKVSIKDWYNTTNTANANQIDVFKTQDGKALVAANVNQLVQAMASFAPPSMGESTLPANYQTSLNTVISANWS